MPGRDRDQADYYYSSSSSAGRHVQVEFHGQRVGIGERGRCVCGVDGRHGRRLRDRRLWVCVEVPESGRRGTGEWHVECLGNKWKLMECLFNSWTNAGGAEDSKLGHGDSTAGALEWSILAGAAVKSTSSDQDQIITAGQSDHVWQRICLKQWIL